MIGILGCGNMGTAIVKGIHKLYPDEFFLTYTPHSKKAKDLANRVKGNATRNLADFKNIKILLIACKPQHFNELSASLEGIEFEKTHFISIMAAISLSTLCQKLKTQRVTRVMPNTPSLLNQGVSLIFHGKEVSSDQREYSRTLFAALGLVHELFNEKKFDQVTTVSGSGPAYLFYFAKCFAEQLESWGLDRGSAKKIIIQLFSGTSELMRQNSEKELQTLLDEVTSKKGVTLEAIKVYEQEGMPLMIEKSLKAAFKRSEVMAKSFQ